MMQRYFIREEDWQGDKVRVTGDDVHHITRVMRMKEGNEIICNHPSGKAASCVIESISPDVVQCEVSEWLEGNSELPVEVSIVQALGKGDKLETVVQKGTEMGAAYFYPYQADRSVVKWDMKKSSKKVERLRKIAKEASEQSHRNVIPGISDVQSMEQILEHSSDYDLKIFAYEDEARTEQFHSLSDAIASLDSGQRMIVFIGPEGGFSDNEVQKLNDSGFISVRLGPRILRMETAPLYLLACVSYQFEEMR
ncbi:16S rRNA (uracil(1498)-N(3))-methyltransferase [Thalassobacillus hwangdonensis]|uniref:Ribosomal RNA small subunit methyltransferase E n=1 Tax=Thalassobacillus hwangdonensis TaxID=546108 RepID=A0ABW3KY42_9BACI